MNEEVMQQWMATAERLSWSLFEEKVGPFGGMAALGSHSAWEAQMECVLKVRHRLLVVLTFRISIIL